LEKIKTSKDNFMTINEKREIIQKKALDILKANNYRGILYISMGVGKTKIAIDAINDNEKVLIVAPYKSVLDNWKKEFKLWNKSSKNVIYCTTASLTKYLSKTYDLIILDEIHLYSNNQLSKIALNRPFNFKLIGLSGTLSDSTKFTISQYLNLNVVFTYTMEEAIKDNIITDYKIKVVNVNIDNNEKYIIGGTKLKPFLTTEKNQYDYLTQQFTNFKNQEFNAPYAEKRKYSSIKMMYASKRANLIYSCKSKLKAAEKIINLNSDSRNLIFTTLTESANKLCKHQYHSKADKNNLEKFSNGEINQLAVVNMANVGLNIKPLHKAIVHQFQSSEETAQQRLGRVIRLEYNNPSKIAEIWVVCLVNTVDELWVKSALNVIPNNKIEYIDYNNL